MTVLLKKVFNYIFWNYVVSPFLILLLPKKNFLFNGKQYKYFYHKYNRTWQNERAIEIPLIVEFINENYKKNSGKILEIGNVLSHYYKNFKKTTIDKYEKDENVLNLDILELYAIDKFDLIISISTFEHIGEIFKDDNFYYDYSKVIYAIKHLKENLLEIDGKALITIPIGPIVYKDLYDYILDDSTYFRQKYYFKCLNKRNEWLQIGKIETKKIILDIKKQYNKKSEIKIINKVNSGYWINPVRGKARALFIGIISN